MDTLPDAAGTEPDSDDTEPLIPLEHRLLTDQQAADWLQVTVRTMGNWQSAGRIPAVYVSEKNPRWLVSDLLDFIAATRQRGAPPSGRHDINIRWKHRAAAVEEQPEAGA